jgi:hypothetical protein
VHERRTLDDSYVFSLEAFGALRQLELDLLPFAEGFVAHIGVYVAEMYEDIGAGLPCDKAEAFVRIKPFNGAGHNGTGHKGRHNCASHK